MKDFFKRAKTFMTSAAVIGSAAYVFSVTPAHAQGVEPGVYAPGLERYGITATQKTRMQKALGQDKKVIVIDSAELAKFFWPAEHGPSSPEENQRAQWQAMRKHVTDAAMTQGYEPEQAAQFGAMAIAPNVLTNYSAAIPYKAFPLSSAKDGAQVSLVSMPDSQAPTDEEYAMGVQFGLPLVKSAKNDRFLAGYRAFCFAHEVGHAADEAFPVVAKKYASQSIMEAFEQRHGSNALHDEALVASFASELREKVGEESNSLERTADKNAVKQIEGDAQLLQNAVDMRFLSFLSARDVPGGVMQYAIMYDFAREVGTVHPEVPAAKLSYLSPQESMKALADLNKALTEIWDVRPDLKRLNDANPGDHRPLTQALAFGLDHSLVKGRGAKQLAQDCLASYERITNQVDLSPIRSAKGPAPVFASPTL